MGRLILDHREAVTLGDVIAAAFDSVEIQLATPTHQLLDERRRAVVDAVAASDQPAYGFNRGFGHNVHLSVDGDPETLGELQKNLIRSHAAAVGPAAPRAVVRAAMFLRAASLSRGYSGVRPQVVTTLIALLNADITPVVPRHGSVSASGDLCALSHIALALIGEGKVRVAGALVDAATALRTAGIEPLQLQMKEGLALNNGCQYLTALGITAAHRLEQLLRVAVINTSIAVQVILGSTQPFRDDLHALRPHPGAQVVARWLRSLTDKSPIAAVHHDHRIDGEVQDPYNLRCAAQILGACIDLLADAERTLEIEANSVTDNPIVLCDQQGAHTDIVSGGHFHGMPVATRIYGLLEAAAIAASLSNSRCARFVDEARNKGLGADLIWLELSAKQRSTSSGLMAAEYTNASLTNSIWGLAMPSHLFSISTDAGQEDHVSMGAPLALRLHDALDHLTRALAVELLFCSQAAALRREQTHFPSRAAIPKSVAPLHDKFAKAIQDDISRQEGCDVEIDISVRKLYPWTPEQRRLAAPGEAILERLNQVSPPIERDRVIAEDIEKIAALIESGDLVDSAEKLADLSR